MQSLRSRAIYKMLSKVESPYDKETQIVKQREVVEKLARFYPVPAKVELQKITINGMAAEWVKPRGVRFDQTILYLHGGGYTMGSINTHRAHTARIASASQTPVLLIDYRLAPEDPFPAGLEDAKMAYRWLLGQKKEAGKIVIAGDSAGGGLAVAAVLALRDEGEILPAGLVCISPWADLSMSGETVTTQAENDPMISLKTSVLHAGRYFAEHDPRNPLISPVFADLKDLPPMLIQVGEYEILKSDSLRLAENGQQAGVEVTLEEWEGMWHVWHMFGEMMPEAQQAIARIGAYITERMNRG